MRSQAKTAARRRLLLAFSVVAVLLGAAACAARVDDRTQKKDISARDLAAQGAGHLRGPVSVVIAAARAHGDLTRDQKRTLATIESELRADRADRHELSTRLQTSAAAVVRSGTADRKAFDRSVNEVMRVIEQRVDDSTNALEELHEILTPAQRKAVAASLRTRIDAKSGHRRARRRHHDGFRRFAAYLALSTLQVDKLKAIKKQFFGEHKRLRPSRQELDALVDAFEGEDFSSALEAFRTEKLAIARERVAHAGERTDTILGIFTPEQRDLLADLILQGPKKVLLGQQPGAQAVTGPAGLTPSGQ